VHSFSWRFFSVRRWIRRARQRGHAGRRFKWGERLAANSERRSPRFCAFAGASWAREILSRLLARSATALAAHAAAQSPRRVGAHRRLKERQGNAALARVLSRSNAFSPPAQSKQMSVRAAMWDRGHGGSWSCGHDGAAPPLPANRAAHLESEVNVTRIAIRGTGAMPAASDQRGGAIAATIAARAGRGRASSPPRIARRKSIKGRPSGMPQSPHAAPLRHRQEIVALAAMLTARRRVLRKEDIK